MKRPLGTIGAAPNSFASARVLALVVLLAGHSVQAREALGQSAGPSRPKTTKQAVARTTTPAVRQPATAVRQPATKNVTGSREESPLRGAAAQTSSVPAGNAAPRPDAAKRTLGDIHIEGEIAVPQVLFITARDQRRFMEFQHRRYLRTSQEVGIQTVLPSRIAVIGNRPADVRKETQR